MASAASQALPAWVSTRLKEYAKRPLRQIAFSDMLKFGPNPSPSHLLNASIFLADELPVRMAHRHQSISALPSLLKPPPVLPSDLHLIQKWYAISFQHLLEYSNEISQWRQNPDAIRLGHAAAQLLPQPKPVFNRLTTWFNGSATASRSYFGDGSVNTLNARPPPTIMEETKNGGWGNPKELMYFGEVVEPHMEAAAGYFNKRFEKILAGIVERHNPIIVLLAKNIRELADSHRLDPTLPHLQTLITKFFRARTGMRILIGHHLSLLRPSHRPNHIGIVSTHTSPSEVASEAAADASEVCERVMGVTPGIQIIDTTRHPLVFVPSHLHHMLFEVVKNALRAVVERHEMFGSEMEEVRIEIGEENEGRSVLIRVSDRGVGIRDGEREKLFRYAYTTARPARLDGGFHGSEVEGAPMAGFGYGLPLSRLYARYFNGDLNVTSKYGYGTDVYITLHRSLEGIMEPYM
ncbi:mitochondrial branched-chain alpha-ketoacid dehydrogenase kinase-domain-containing protein [Chytridium lagenaria]|nr:mitochondrial branched-chain alpha-ketoacid dehydrogenase kinase-domain-containing protein [Chytridium lagenaria]